MARPSAFSLRIFVADGDPDGLQVVDRTNWVGKAVVFPRSSYPAVRSRSEIKHTGVYLLLGPNDTGPGEKLYIGEGDPVDNRLYDHGKKREFWNRAIFFVAPGFLNKAHVQFLEARLVALAQAAKRVELDNETTPTEPSLSEADRADMLVFLDNLLGMLPVLGVTAFVQATSKPEPGDSPELVCRGKGVTAQGRYTTQGFIVNRGSSAVTVEVPSLPVNFPNVTALRTELRKNGVLAEDEDALRFTQDYTFSSPSLAAAIVLGHAGGLSHWKDSAGRTLRDILAAQAEAESTE